VPAGSLEGGGGGGKYLPSAGSGEKKKRNVESVGVTRETRLRQEASGKQPSNGEKEKEMGGRTRYCRFIRRRFSVRKGERRGPA